MTLSKRHLRFLCVCGLLVFSIAAVSAQTGSGKWAFLKLKAGEYFKYAMKSDRGLSGWVSIKAEDAGGGVLKVTLAGEWAGSFSEVQKLKPGMSGQDLYYKIKDPTASNAMGSILFFDNALVDDTTWKDGFTWSQGTRSIAVKDSKTCLGVQGLLATFTSKSFGKVQKSVYCVNPAFPLPIYVSVPGANDTFTLELTEKKGI